MASDIFYISHQFPLLFPCSMSVGGRFTCSTSVLDLFPCSQCSCCSCRVEDEAVLDRGASFVKHVCDEEEVEGKEHWASDVYDGWLTMLIYNVSFSHASQPPTPQVYPFYFSLLSLPRTSSLHHFSHPFLSCAILFCQLSLSTTLFRSTLSPGLCFLLVLYCCGFPTNIRMTYRRD